MSLCLDREWGLHLTIPWSRDEAVACMIEPLTYRGIEVVQGRMRNLTCISCVDSVRNRAWAFKFLPGPRDIDCCLIPTVGPGPTSQGYTVFNLYRGF